MVSIRKELVVASLALMATSLAYSTEPVLSTTLAGTPVQLAQADDRTPGAGAQAQHRQGHGHGGRNGMGMHEQGERGMGMHGRGEGHMKHGERARHGGDHGARQLLRGLDLTQAQRDQLFELRHRQMPQMRALRQQMRSASQALREATMAETLDESVVSARAAAMGAAFAEIQKSRAVMLTGMLGILDAQQAATVRERMKSQGHTGHKAS